MSNAPYVIEQTLDAPISRVWRAITDKEQMKEWYFDIAAFEPHVGYEFQFNAGSAEKQYLHLCKVLDVVAERKLTYSWRYDGYPGDSVVTFELFDEGENARVRLTHEGLETFPQDKPEFTRDSFAQGWTHIIGTSLREFVEQRG